MKDHLIIEAIIRAYDDENGVSEKLHDTLVELGQHLPDFGTPIFDAVEVQDSRFYIDEDEAQRLLNQYYVLDRQTVFS